MSTQIKVPDFDIIKEFDEKLKETTTDDDFMEVIKEYQHKIFKDNV
tara:strand:+ start:60 stop:197 length:138 start_codon:yes stop_codon:yes gene_type:complete